MLPGPGFSEEVVLVEALVGQIRGPVVYIGCLFGGLMKTFLEWMEEVGSLGVEKRDALLAELRAKFPGEFLKTSEEFSPGRVGGIWITGKTMADYYGKDNTGFDYWVNPKLQRILKKHSFYLEPYDSETWLAWPV
jgi:hypothetical protein